MKRSILYLAFALGILATGRDPRAAEQPKGGLGSGKSELVLQYDFSSVHGTRVGDGSGKKHDGELKGGEIVEGRRNPALQLNGDGLISMAEIPDSLNPRSRALTIGALCKPATADGIVAAMGDRANGFSLYLKGGVPQFAVRASGELFKVAGDEPVPMDQWVHLIGTLDAKGVLWLIVDGWPVAHAKGKLIPQKPAEPFCVGADTGSPVGEYGNARHWRGLLEDVRLYWGFMNRNENWEELQDWADLPACGCRK